MAAIFENHICYFCDERYPHPSCFIDNHNGIWLCSNCEDFKLPINLDVEEKGECCVCFENNSLFKLPTCIHKVCLQCCKTIYFGSTTTERPVHWREIIDDVCPLWPYEINEEDEIEDLNQEKYYYFEELHFDYETKSYAELITIRDSLIRERPEWMNTESFINYENDYIRYQTKIHNVEKEWDNWNENKTRGNCICPLCRAKPF